MTQMEITPQEMYEKIRQANISDVNSFEARDGNSLYYRHYSADSEKILVLLHGIAEDGKYLFQFAEHMSVNNLAEVYLLDLRGYGMYPKRRGDVDYIGQIDDDLADFLRWVKEEKGNRTIILGGHSFGGASVLRYAGTPPAAEADAYLFLAPYLHPNAPMNRENDKDSHSKVSVPRLVLLTILDKLNIRWFHRMEVLSVNKPQETHHGSETLSLSYRLLMSRMPADYKAAVGNISKPSLVLIGGRDELFYPEKVVDIFKKNPKITANILPQHNHDGILFSDRTYTHVKAWLTTV